MNNQLKVSLENIIPLTEARDHFSQIVAEVQKDKLYVLTKGGKPAVAIIDVKYLEHLTGGEIRKEDIKEEIKRVPEKAGLAPMLEHPPTKPAGFAAPQPPTPTTPSPEPPPKTDVTPAKPAGFAASQAPPPPNPSTPSPAAAAEKPVTWPPPSTPAPVSPPANSLKMPPLSEQKGDKIDVQFAADTTQDKNPTSKTDRMAPDDKPTTAQYAGSSDGEPEDMALD